MSSNQAEDFAQRLYSRIPGHYRVYDAERGQPLLALMRVVGAQMANVRQDLDTLWDNFFIETCDDWVVPYLGALVGANLLQQPVGQSNRLDVWNTVIWRRSKGTPQMLQALSDAISGWPADLAEFFLSLGWSQNVNHVRMERPLTPDLRDPSQLKLLGHANDPFAHAADFKPSRPLDSSRVTGNSLGIGIAAWGTPGRYQINTSGYSFAVCKLFRHGERHLLLCHQVGQLRREHPASPSIHSFETSLCSIWTVLPLFHGQRSLLTPGPVLVRRQTLRYVSSEFF